MDADILYHIMLAVESQALEPWDATSSHPQKAVNRDVEWKQTAMSLRLVCRETARRRVLLQCIYSTVYWLPTLASLDRLINIVECPHLVSAVRNVVVCTTQWAYENRTISSYDECSSDLKSGDYLDTCFHLNSTDGYHSTPQGHRNALWQFENEAEAVVSGRESDLIRILQGLRPTNVSLIRTHYNPYKLPFYWSHLRAHIYGQQLVPNPTDQQDRQGGLWLRAVWKALQTSSIQITGLKIALGPARHLFGRYSGVSRLKRLHLDLTLGITTEQNGMGPVLRNLECLEDLTFTGNWRLELRFDFSTFNALGLRRLVLNRVDIATTCLEKVSEAFPSLKELVLHEVTLLEPQLWLGGIARHKWWRTFLGELREKAFIKFSESSWGLRELRPLSRLCIDCELAGTVRSDCRCPCDNCFLARPNQCATCTAVHTDLEGFIIGRQPWTCVLQQNFIPIRKRDLRI